LESGQETDSSKNRTSAKLKKVLPHKETTIGTFETEFISSDIRAKSLIFT